VQAGSLWDQRLQQYLLANGVAVLVVNPAEQDSWDVGPSSWKVRGFQNVVYCQHASADNVWSSSQRAN
jgi:hypothetical protein